MTYRIVDNKKYGTVTLLFTASNGGIVIAGNTTTSNIATSDEILAGASINMVWFGSPSGNAAYWTISRGSNNIMTLDSTAYIDFKGNGLTIKLDSAATLSANLVGTGNGSLYIQLGKIPAANGFPTS